MIQIKCFALWQPWATLVIEGLKGYETRPLYSKHRGITGILATKSSPDWAEALFYQEPFYSRLKAKGYEKFSDLPTGGVIGAVQVKEWLKIVHNDRKPIHPKVEINPVKNETEIAFGNWHPGRYAIALDDPKKFDKTFLVNGRQNMLFDVEIPETLIIK